MGETYREIAKQIASVCGKMMNEEREVIKNDVFYFFN